jgi:hypothetical protein
MAKMGRPTKYKPEYIQAILDYFCVEPTTTVEETVITASGINKIKKIHAVRYPTLERFAVSHAVTVTTLHEWASKYPDFSYAMQLAKSAAKAILIENTLESRYSEGFAKFVAINCTDMVDKSTQERTGPNGGPLQVDNKIEIVFVRPEAKDAS